MDSNEEAGLRAFTLLAIYANGVARMPGEATPRVPQWLDRDGRRTEIIAVESQWREEERYGYRVRLAHGGASALLYYIPELDLWSGAIDVPE